MGCVQSLSHSHHKATLVPRIPESKGNETQLLEKLDALRRSFWESKHEGSEQVWIVLKKCCEASLKQDQISVNRLLSENKLSKVSDDLHIIETEEKVQYILEPYCYSNQSSQLSQVTHIRSSNDPNNCAVNNRFHFRICTSFLENERDVIFVFGEEESTIPLSTRISSSTHPIYRTYYFPEHVTAVSDYDIRKILGEIVFDFPETQEKEVNIDNVRIFCLGRELGRSTSFAKNNIPFDTIILVFIQSH